MGLSVPLSYPELPVPSLSVLLAAEEAELGDLQRITMGTQLTPETADQLSTGRWQG